LGSLCVALPAFCTNQRRHRSPLHLARCRPLAATRKLLTRQTNLLLLLLTSQKRWTVLDTHPAFLFQ